MEICDKEKVGLHFVFLLTLYYNVLINREYIIWMCGNMIFISSIDQDIKHKILHKNIKKREREAILKKNAPEK